jgi:hypothetical protein
MSAFKGTMGLPAYDQTKWEKRGRWCYHQRPLFENVQSGGVTSFAVPFYVANEEDNY